MIEIRDVSPKAWATTGWATTWSYSPDRGTYFVNGREGTFLERIKRGAFSAAVEGREPVELRREHNRAGPVFASTTRGTMRLADESEGLLLAAALSQADPATQLAVADVRSGKLSGLSVGMTVRADNWATAADGRTALRTISEAGLSEVSIVSRPANPQAVVVDIRCDETRSGDIEYRHIPLLYSEGRQWTNQHGQECATCAGSGACPDCGGQGWTPRERSSVLLVDDSDDLWQELQWLALK